MWAPLARAASYSAQACFGSGATVADAERWSCCFFEGSRQAWVLENERRVAAPHKTIQALSVWLSTSRAHVYREPPMATRIPWRSQGAVLQPGLWGDNVLLGRDDQAAFVGGVRVRLRAPPKRGLPDAPVEGVGEPVPRAAAEHGGDVGAQDAAGEGGEQDGKKKSTRGACSEDEYGLEGTTCSYDEERGKERWEREERDHRAPEEDHSHPCLPSSVARQQLNSNLSYRGGAGG